MTTTPSRAPLRLRDGEFTSIRVRIIGADQEFGYAVQVVKPDGKPVDPESRIYLTRQELVEGRV